MTTESSLKRLAAAKEKKAAKADEYREAKKAARKNLRPRPELARPATKEQKARVVPEILARVDSGWHLVRALEDVEGAPNKLMWYNWLRRDPKLNQQYQEARQRGFMTLADELHEISDTPHIGKTTTQVTDSQGVSIKVVEEDMLSHRSLQVSTRKWLLSKMLPKVFGDRLTVDAPDGQAFSDSLKELAKKLPV